MEARGKHNPGWSAKPGAIARLWRRVYDGPAMQSRSLRLSELPHSSRLFSDFVDEWKRVAAFYAHPFTLSGIGNAARSAALPEHTRREVVDILREQNQSLGADANTSKNLDRLAAGAVAIVTGQQIGLFSGPAFCFYKALTAARLARELTDAGTQAVPVFWLATEDHDYAEIGHTDFLTTDGTLRRLELAAAPDSAGRRVGNIVLGDEVSHLAREAAAALEGPDVDELGATLAVAYRPGEGLGKAFGELMARLLAGRGLIFLDPLDARLHRLAGPLLRAAIEKRAELNQALLERKKRLEKAGYHAQVRVTERSTLLFLDVEGRREAVRRRGDTLAAGADTFSEDEILQRLEHQPESFSANVLLRPVMQDALLPTAAYVGGPAEVAYFAQSEVIYRLLGRPMPAIVPRAGFTLVEPLAQRLLKKYGLDVRDLFLGRQRVRALMEGKGLPRELAHRFRTADRRLSDAVAKIRSPLGKLDKTLLGALDTSTRKMRFQLERLRGKAARAENFRTGVLHRHEHILFDSLFPHHQPQERSVCLLPMLARHGLTLLGELEAQIDPAQPRHHVVSL